MSLYALTAHQTLTLWTCKEVVELNGNIQITNTCHSGCLNSYLMRLTPHPRKMSSGSEIHWIPVLKTTFCLVEQPTGTKVSWV